MFTDQETKRLAVTRVLLKIKISTFARASASRARAISLVPLSAAFAGSIETSATFDIDVTARTPLGSSKWDTTVGSGLFWREAVFAPDRNLLFNQRSQSSGVQDFSAIVCKLCRLGIA